MILVNICCVFISMNITFFSQYAYCQDQVIRNAIVGLLSYYYSIDILYKDVQRSLENFGVNQIAHTNKNKRTTRFLI